MCCGRAGDGGWLGNPPPRMSVCCAFLPLCVGLCGLGHKCFCSYSACFRRMDVMVRHQVLGAVDVGVGGCPPGAPCLPFIGMPFTPVCCALSLPCGRVPFPLSVMW